MRKVGAQLIVGDVVRAVSGYGFHLIVEVLGPRHSETGKVYLTARCADTWNGYGQDFVPFLKATYYDVYGNFPDLVEMAIARSIVNDALYSAWCLKRDEYLSEVYG